MDVVPPDLQAVLSHERFVRATARAILGVDDRVEDVVQESLVSALRSGPAIVGVLRAWLGTVARRKAIDVLRRESARRRAEGAAPTPRAAPSPVEIATQEETRRVLVAELLGLDAPSRDVLVLRFYEGLAPREIAARLGVPVETVRTRTRRAIERLRERLDARRGPRRAWVVALASATGLAVVPTGSLVTSWGAVCTAAALVAAVSVAVWGAWGKGDGQRAPVREVGALPPDAVEGPALAASGPVGRRHPGVAAGTIGIVGYVTDGARPVRARVEVRSFQPRDGDRPWTAMLRPAEWTAEADARGRFVIEGLAPGTYLVAASDGVGAERFVELPLGDDGARVDVRLELLRGPATLRGRVRTADGAPARGHVFAYVETYKEFDGGRLPQPLGDHGEFELQGLDPGGVVLQGRFEGLATSQSLTWTGRGDVEWSLGRDEPSRADRWRGGVIEGRVRDRQGQPVPSVTVHAQVRARDGTIHGSAADAGPDGRFRVEGLPRGEVTVWVLDRGFMSQGLADATDGAFNPFTVALEQADRAAVDVIVEPAAKVRGLVVDERGYPLARAIVRQRMAREAGARHEMRLGGTSRTVTDAAGRFEIHAAVPGRSYELEVYGAGILWTPSEPLTAPADVRLVARSIDEDAWVEVRVTDATRGGPLAAADVDVVELWRDGYGGIGISGRTNDDGRAILGPLPRARLGIRVHHPDLRTQEPREIRGESLEILVESTPPAFAGRVYLPPDVLPQFVAVEVLDPTGQRVGDDVRCARDATFRVPGPLPAGRYRLRFHTELPPPLAATVEAEMGRSDLEVELKPKVSAPEVDAIPAQPWVFTLRDEAGREIPRSRLELWKSGGRTAWELEGARFELTLRGGSPRRWVQVLEPRDAEGRPLPLAAVLLPREQWDEKGQPVEVVFPAERPIEGIVVDEAGAPRAGVLVHATPKRDAPAAFSRVGSSRTAADGAFRLGGTDAGEFRVVAEAAPGVLATQGVFRGGDRGLRLVQRRAARPEVRVVQSDGRPCRGALVEVRPLVGTDADTDPTGHEVLARATTDATGAAQLVGLDPARRYRLEVQPPEDVPAFGAEIHAWDASDVEVRLEAAHVVTGRIVDREGAPIAGARVYVDSRGGGVSAESGVDGRFKLRGVRAGSVVLRATYGAMRTPETLTEAGRDVGDVPLDRGVPLQVRIRDCPPSPAPGVSIGVRWGSTTGSTDAGGAAAGQDRLSNDTWTLVAVPAGRPFAVYVGPWPDGRYALGRGMRGGGDVHELVLREGRPIAGRVASAVALSSGLVTVVLEDGLRLYATIAPDGTFRLDGVPPGSYTLTVSGTAAETWVQGRVEGVAAGRTDLEIPVAPVR